MARKRGTKAGVRSRRRAPAFTLAEMRAGEKAARVHLARKELRSNKNYDQWISGFQMREAERTGKFPSVASVRRNPRFNKSVNVLLAHVPSRKKPKANSHVAHALVELGIRDPSFKGAVGNSPKASARAQYRAWKKQHNRR